MFIKESLIPIKNIKMTKKSDIIKFKMPIDFRCMIFSLEF